ncbi:PI31 proteasome regulator N-terminal-domain-containing protein [Phaeosphaeria sp. MPI-PUGE-AT-0046c]|nr:PI31 proteasome regulator N-terminal-domain-containing protein [Phaeosphaeria sp. MPI-PUGE-AT-0046c]
MVQDKTGGNPLSAGSLALFMATSLPKSDSPQLKNTTEAIALAIHAGMLAVGFRLIGLGEDERIEAYSDAEDPRPLPSQWNASSSYAFRYAHAQSAMEYLIKVNRLGSKSVVYGLAIGDDKTTHFDVTTNDYLSPSSIPLTISQDTSDQDAAKKLQDLFISAGRLNDLGALFKISILQKLAPGIGKQGAEESNTDREQTPTADQSAPRRGQPPNARDPPNEPEPARPYPFNDPLARPQGNRPLPEPMPGFEDEYEINRPARGGLRDDRYPVGIGHDDLYPQGLGPNDPMRPHLGPGIPRPGFGGGGGMHPTFDDPLFRGQGGVGGYDPMAPPGARYDPVGPGGAPRDNRGGGRFPGGGGFGGPGGRPPNPFGGFGDGDFI